MESFLTLTSSRIRKLVMLAISVGLCLHDSVNSQLYTQLNQHFVSVKDSDGINLCPIDSSSSSYSQPLIRGASFQRILCAEQCTAQINCTAFTLSEGLTQCGLYDYIPRNYIIQPNGQDCISYRVGRIMLASGFLLADKYKLNTFSYQRKTNIH